MLGQDLLKGKQKVKTADILAKKPKLVMFYFSMHTCPPCREFTPLLSCLYEEMNEDEHQFEVVFFSGDQTQDSFDHYYAEMPWLAMPWKDARLKPIAKQFKVKGLPQLIVVNAKGDVVMSQAVSTVTEKGPIAIEAWIMQ
jgi:nucleoredoxin